MPLKVRISIPDQAKAGEIVEIKTLVSHPMESGYRLGSRGEAIEQNILQRFTASYDGATIFEIEYGPGIAANPFVAFYVRATNSGPVTFEWVDANEEVTVLERTLTVI